MERNITVLGGGLTGLSSAFHLARRFPATKVTLVEKQTKLGGWVRSERVKIPGQDSTVLLEAGPRTLRPNAPSVLELINLLGLKDRVITVSKSSEAAKSRYLYIPPEYGEFLWGLRRIPTTALSLLTSPLSTVLVPAVLRDALKLDNLPEGVTDESVDSFLRRRFGNKFAQIFGSALIHGIYAADSRQIGIRSAFPTMWEAAERGWGSIIRGELRQAKKATPQEYDTGSIPELMKQASVYSFRDGLQTLTDTLEQHLEKLGNVEILRGTSVASVRFEGTQPAVELDNGRSISPSRIISALPTQRLHQLLTPPPHNPQPFSHLTANPTSSVHVVNIVFPGPPASIHPAGFGYLIPRPQQDYPSNADEQVGILGTVFDSCSLGAQDTNPSGKTGYRDAEFTKLTVMVGGPYPLPELPLQLCFSDGGVAPPPYMQRILKRLSAHLSRPLPRPIYWRIQPNEQCIPTLLPGHQEKMAELRATLLGQFGGKIQIVGAGVGGVSVGDCVEAGRRAALGVTLD